MTLLYSLGYNAFQQSSPQDNAIVIKEPACHENTRVVYASWETTIVIKDSGELDIWGFKPNWFDKVLTKSRNRHIISIIGSTETLFCILDIHHVLTCVTCDLAFDITNVKQAVYCSMLNSLFILFNDATVQQYDIHGKTHEHVLDNVKYMCGSETHVLFSTYSSNTPLFGIGSNRLSQLGLDSFECQRLLSVENIDYFNELGVISDMDCGTFHSAIVLNGDVYTFGWSKEGRLGWGSNNKEENDDLIRCATFLNDRHELVDNIHIKKVACGTLHTLVLDTQGTVWSCGSNKYGQLGREIQEESDAYFRRLSIIKEEIIDINAGHWNTFLYQ